MPPKFAKGLVLDTETCKTHKNFKEVWTENFDIAFAKSFEEASQSAASGLVDFMVIHELPNTQGLELVHEFRMVAPSMPMILLCEAASGTWSQAVSDPRLELVFSQAPPQELQHRIIKLLRFKSKILMPKTRSPVEPIPSLRSKNGRLDAERVADCFGITLSDLARTLDKPYSTIHKTPDAVSLQKSLYPYERIACAIKTITGGKLEKGLKIWLNAPNKALPDSLPIDLIKNGHVGMLADMLEDVLLGQPG